MSNKEKIAFSFPSEKSGIITKVAHPTLIRVVPSNISVMDFGLTIGVTNGFLNLIPNKSYALKIHVYKDDRKVFCSPNPDAGYVIEPTEREAKNGKVSAVSTDDVSILEEPVSGIYELRVQLCDISQHDLILDEKSSFFELVVSKESEKN